MMYHRTRDIAAKIFVADFVQVQPFTVGNHACEKDRELVL